MLKSFPGRPCRVVIILKMSVTVCRFLRFILRLRYFTQMTLGTFSRGTFLFLQNSRIWPFYCIFWPFLALVLKRGADFVWSVQFLSFFAWASPWGSPRCPFLNFSKICVFAPVTAVRHFSFFQNRRILPFFCKNLHKVLCRFFLAGPGS